MSYLRDGPGVTAPLRTNIAPLMAVWNTPFRYTPLKKSPIFPGDTTIRFRLFCPYFRPEARNPLYLRHANPEGPKRHLDAVSDELPRVSSQLPPHVPSSRCNLERPFLAILSHKRGLSHAQILFYFQICAKMCKDVQEAPLCNTSVVIPPARHQPLVVRDNSGDASGDTFGEGKGESKNSCETMLPHDNAATRHSDLREVNRSFPNQGLHCDPAGLVFGLRVTKESLASCNPHQYFAPGEAGQNKISHRASSSFGKLTLELSGLHSLLSVHKRMLH